MLDGLAAIVVAAGRGERFGASSKVLTPLNGVPLLKFSIDLINSIPGLDQVVFVLGDHTLEAGRELVAAQCRVTWDCVTGGASRSDSVQAGLHAVRNRGGLVLVHDAARPLATNQLLRQLIDAAKQFGAAVPAVAVTNSLLEIAGDGELAPVDRSRFRAVQTPQVARYDWLVEALGTASEPTDESSALLAAGFPIELVDGEPENIKITHPGDLVIAEALLRAREGGV